MINTQAVPQALQMGGKEAYHSPGELDICCCCCFVVVVLLGVTVFCVVNQVVIYFSFLIFRHLHFLCDPARGEDLSLALSLSECENSNTRTSSLSARVLSLS